MTNPSVKIDNEKLVAHTQGAWEIEDITSPDRDDGSVAIGGKGWGALAKVVVRMQEDDKNSREGEANARLIAAAPDMYEALKRLSAVAESIYVKVSEDEMRIMREAWDKADAAIRKAAQS